MISAHLSKELRTQYKRRSMSIRKGDEVKIIRGKHSGKTGTVEEVNLKKMSILLSGLKVKRTIGTEKQIPVEPSNLVITTMNMGDKMRQKILLRKVKDVKFEEPKPAEPKPAEKKEAKQEKPVEKKVETKAKKKEIKHAPKKTTHAKVLANAKKKKNVGSSTKTRSA